MPGWLPEEWQIAAAASMWACFPQRLCQWMACKPFNLPNLSICAYSQWQNGSNGIISQRVLPAFWLYQALPCSTCSKKYKCIKTWLGRDWYLQSDLVRGYGESSSNGNARASDGQHPHIVAGSTFVEHSFQIQIWGLQAILQSCEKLR